MRKVEEINKEIETLKKELDTLEGTTTEVYTRIVGYYRSVRNWNKGKREEYNYRVPFALPGEKRNSSSDEPAVRWIDQEVQKELFGSGNGEDEPLDTADAAGYLYFYRDTCPNCPPVWAALEELDFAGEKINVDTPRGMEEARKRGILSAPTVIFLSSSREELFQTSQVREIREYSRALYEAQALSTREKAGAGV